MPQSWSNWISLRAGLLASQSLAANLETEIDFEVTFDCTKYSFETIPAQTIYVGQNASIQISN
jgi:hypothetical protein